MDEKFVSTYILFNYMNKFKHITKNKAEIRNK